MSAMKTLRPWNHVGRIRPSVWDALRQLPRGSEHTYPCSVEQNDTTRWPRVLFAERKDYDQWYHGTYAMNVPFLDVETVMSVGPSPSKTPVAIEKRMYRHGETRMGGFVVTFVLRDGTQFVHAGGDFCEFVSVPEGYLPDDIVDVVFEGDDRTDLGKTQWLKSPDWKWCIFERP